MLGKALTFDDVLLVPEYSEVTPDMVDVSAWLTPSIKLGIPFISAAMDTVTESEMAISMARQGGIGIIHKNMDVARQRLEVEKVKKSESGMILDPVTVAPDDTVKHALELMSAGRFGPDGYHETQGGESESAVPERYDPLCIFEIYLREESADHLYE